MTGPCQREGVNAFGIFFFLFFFFSSFVLSFFLFYFELRLFIMHVSCFGA